MEGNGVGEGKKIVSITMRTQISARVNDSVACKVIVVHFDLPAYHNGDHILVI